MSRVVVLGSLNSDLHLRVTRHPTPGETVVADGLARRFGGKGGNQAIAAARAGAATAMIGRVGDDEPGRTYKERLAGFGVDATGVRVDTGQPTGTAVIINDAAGENMIAVALGANAAVGTADDLAPVGELSAGDVLLMPLELDHAVVVAAARTAHGRGARVIINLAPYGSLPADVLDLADPVVVNESEARELAGAGLRARSLLVTLGPDGSRWGERSVPARAVDVVDTTGAGDAYCGTLAARLALGDTPEAAMRAATGAAAAAVSHAGAQPPLPAAEGRPDA